MIFNVERFKEFMKVVVDLGLHEKMYILAGVGPLKSPGMARYMRDSVAGMEVSAKWVERMEKTPKEKWKDEGMNVCVEIINEMREIPGVAGVHIMSIEWEEAVPTIVERAGLLPRPKASELVTPTPQPVAVAA
jgi:methylenetetrahydrofolate reductase (NADPH)